jgi:hypothetical protein
MIAGENFLIKVVNPGCYGFSSILKKSDCR